MLKLSQNITPNQYTFYILLFWIKVQESPNLPSNSLKRTHSKLRRTYPKLRLTYTKLRRPYPKLWLQLPIG